MPVLAYIDAPLQRVAVRLDDSASSGHESVLARPQGEDRRRCWARIVQSTGRSHLRSGRNFSEALRKLAEEGKPLTPGKASGKKGKDLTSIEEAFSKVKGLLRRAGARTCEAPIEAMGRALDAVTFRGRSRVLRAPRLWATGPISMTNALGPVCCNDIDPARSSLAGPLSLSTVQALIARGEPIQLSCKPL
jgi:hypothetical protein